MNVLIGVAVLLVVAIVVMAWLLGRGNKPDLWDDNQWVVDPLDLMPLGQKTARVFVSALPRDGWPQEVVPLIVNEANRQIFLRHGPLAFAQAFRRLGLHGHTCCLVGSSAETATLLPLDTLRLKLFGNEELTQDMVRMIHDLTEVDLGSVEDEEVVAAHLVRSGFLPLEQSAERPAEQKLKPVCPQVGRSDAVRMWCDEDM